MAATTAMDMPPGQHLPEQLADVGVRTRRQCTGAGGRQRRDVDEMGTDDHCPCDRQTSLPPSRSTRPGTVGRNAGSTTPDVLLYTEIDTAEECDDCQ